jgi:hypothetical protein
MKEFIEILKVLESELEERKERAKEFYELFEKTKDENIRLRNENEMLRNDLFELSKEHFKK